MSPDETGTKEAVKSGSILFAMKTTEVCKQMRGQMTIVVNGRKRGEKRLSVSVWIQTWSNILLDLIWVQTVRTVIRQQNLPSAGKLSATLS